MCYVRFKINKVDFETSLTSLGLQFKIVNFELHTTHMNPKIKENNNLQFNNLKSPIAKVFKNNKWVYVDKDELIKELHDDNVTYTEKWIDDNKDKVPKYAKEKIKDYKRISPHYKEKEIYTEINKKGYLFTKNHIENELDS